MRVLVLSRRQVEDGAAQGADAVVSVRGTAARGLGTLDEALAQAVLGDCGAVLRLALDDIGVPALGPLRGPTQAQVDEAVDFGRALRSAMPDPLVAVHCELGRSRSSALALALLADALGPGGEGEAVRRVLRLDAEGTMAPNPLLVRLADAALWRYGALEAALLDASPAYAAARAHWQAVAADPDAAWAAMRARRRPRNATRAPEAWEEPA